MFTRSLLIFVLPESKKSDGRDCFWSKVEFLRMPLIRLLPVTDSAGDGEEGRLKEVATGG